MGIGNELKYDDGVGPFIISELNKLNLNDNILLINPTHVILIDACLMGLNPGDYRIVDENDFANIGISTHSMSLSYFVKFINQDNILFIGIEPELMELIDQDSLGSLDENLMNFHGELTDDVLKSAEEIIGIFGELL